MIEGEICADTGDVVALSLREQLLEDSSVPMGELDWKMDAVITPDSDDTIAG